VITDSGIVSIGGVGIAMAKGPEAFADALRKAHDLGQDLVLAIKKEKQFPEGEAQVRERKEFFKNLVIANKDPWQFQYEFWVERKEIKQ
jgi:hypothetical protein